MNIVSIYNIKGGVGKTAAAVNLAYLSAFDGFRTLLCDFDPQGSASFYFRTQPSEKSKVKKIIRKKKNVLENVKGSDFENLDILPAHMSFRKFDIVLEKQKKPGEVIRNLFKGMETHYDTIFIDCPPNITLLSENIIAASDKILVPLIPTTLSVISYQKLLEFILRKDMDSSKLLAFFSMFEKRKSVHRDTVEKVPAQSGGIFLTTAIPYSSVIEKMGLTRQPVPASNPNSPASAAYVRLWNELKKHLFAPISN